MYGYCGNSGQYIVFEYGDKFFYCASVVCIYCVNLKQILTMPGVQVFDSVISNTKVIISLSTLTSSIVSWQHTNKENLRL